MSTIHITFFLLFSFIFYFPNVSAVPTRHMCRPEQRDALLKFKNEFDTGKPSFDDWYTNDYCYINGSDVIPYPKTESWKNNSDCCYWDGIRCDAKSGEVMELDLSCSCLHGRFDSNTFQNIRFLTTIDLSWNDLYGQIPSSIGELSHLTSLNLSRNHFFGQIPSSIGNLSYLTSLNLDYNNFSGQIPSSIGNLTHLTFLRLSRNQFSGQISSSIENLSHLTFLRLSFNQFSGQIPSSIENLSHLTSLDLSYNQFSGQIPSSIGSLSHLESLGLSGNSFDGEIPSSIGSLSHLESLRLSDNSFDGEIPSSFGSLKQLASLRLGYNKLSGNFPVALLNLTKISSPSTLEELSLGGNNFKGPIPGSVSKLVNLTRLDLSHWNTQGPVDFSIFSHLKSLSYLYLSHLNTTTTIDLNAISSFSQSLESLDLSGNHVLATKKSSVSDYPSQLIRDLNLSGCGITEFPELVRSQQHIEFLDISNNKITGQVPGWLWTLPNLYYVNLSNNTFIGFQRSTKHGLPSTLEYLFGSKNKFTRKIPSLICELRSLSTLDLSNNNFNGSIPLCMGNLKGNFSVLNLRQNRLSGGLPENVFENLRSLDVGHNQLVGKLPGSLIHFSALEVLNVESNRINDTFPFWLSSLQNLQVLVLRSNAFHGPIRQASFLKLKIIDISHNHFNGTLPSDYFVSWSAMSSLGINKYVNYMGGYYYQDSMVLMNKGIEMKLERILTIYTALDFSGNRLEGEIPSSVGLLKELHVLNLSSNAFTGHIPSSFGKLTALESLDLSQNKLSGEIPQELGNLSFIEYMNFSHNQLAGLVPGGTQFRTQPCSSFEHNPGLLGPAFEEVCRDIHTPSSQRSETTEPEEEDEEVFSWIAAAIGFVPGITFGLKIGYIMVSYKPEWFTSPFRRNKRRRRSTTTH